jgi:hypothetical protein
LLFTTSPASSETSVAPARARDIPRRQRFSRNKHRGGWTLQDGLWVEQVTRSWCHRTLTCGDVLLCLHDDTMGAHSMDVERTYNGEGPIYYWPGLYRDVAQFVRLCRRRAETE